MRDRTVENGGHPASRAEGGLLPLRPGVDLPDTVYFERTEASASPAGYRTAAPTRGQLLIRCRPSGRTGGNALGVIALADVSCGYVAAALAGEDGALTFSGLLVDSGPTLVLLVPIYMGLSLVINRTTTTVSDGRLRSRRGPLPPWRSRDVPIEAVKQLYATRDVTGREPTFSVYARVDGQAPLLVAEGLSTLEQARTIEQAIGEHVRDEDSAPE